MHWTYFIEELSGLPSPVRLLAVCVSAILYVAIFSGPGPFTIISVSIGACNDIIKVTYMEVSHVTIYSSYRPCMTLWCNALLYQAVLQVHWTVWSLRPPLCTWPMFQTEPDCLSYPTERYTVDVDWMQVADLTADAVQSLAINHANGSVTLFLPLLSQPLPENAVTLNMTKYNTVPTNTSDATGNIVTEMVRWATSAVFGELELFFCMHKRYCLNS